MQDYIILSTKLVVLAGVMLIAGILMSAEAGVLFVKFILEPLVFPHEKLVLPQAFFMGIEVVGGGSAIILLDGTSFIESGPSVTHLRRYNILRVYHRQ